MKERPILFSAPMVRALLDGSKTQTRRVVKHRWPHMWQEPYYATGKVLADLPTQPGAFMEFRTRRQDDPSYQGSTASFLVPCPYGRAGPALGARNSRATGGLLGIMGAVATRRRGRAADHPLRGRLQAFPE